MISERTLKNWRMDSLHYTEVPGKMSDQETMIKVSRLVELHKRILRLTQELMDNKLLRGV